MIYGVNAILESQKKLQENSVHHHEEFISENTSFFLEVLDELVKENFSFNKMMYENNDEVIEEGIGSAIAKAIWNKLKSVDIKKLLFKVFEMFGQLLQKIWNHFKAFMVQFNSKSYNFKKYDKQLKNFDKDLIYADTIHTYTDLGAYRGYISFKSAVEEAYNSLLRDTEQILTTKDISKLAQILNNIKQENNNLVVDVDTIRGRALMVGDPIPQEQFANYLYNKFRGFNPQGYEPGTIPADQVRSRYEFINSSSKLEQEVSNDKDTLLRESKSIGNKIKSWRLEDHFKGEIDEQTASEFMRVASYYIQYNKSICEIFVQILAAKMDAIKEAKIEAVNICTAAVREIVRSGGASS